MKLKFKFTIFCILALLLVGVACAGTVISVPADGPGEDGSLSVMVSGVSDVTGVSFLIEYNKDSLAVESASLGELFAGASLTKNVDNDAGTAKFVIITTSEISAVEASELVNVKFNVIDPADKAITVADSEWSGMDFLPHGFDSVIDGAVPEPTATATAAPTSSSSSSGGYISYTASPTAVATETPTAVKTSAPEATVSATEEPTAAVTDEISAEPAEVTVTPTVKGNESAVPEPEPTEPVSTPGFGIIVALLSVAFAAVLISARK